MKKALLLQVFCLALLARCGVWNQPIISSIEKRVNEIRSIHTIFVKTPPSANTFIAGEDAIPYDAEGWAAKGLEIGGLNGLNETRDLLPVQDYEVDPLADPDVPGEKTVTVRLNDPDRNYEIRTEFVISVLTPGEIYRRIEPYILDAGDGEKHRVLAVPSIISGPELEDSGDAGLPVAIKIYPANGYTLVENSLAYSYALPPSKEKQLVLTDGEYKFKTSDFPAGKSRLYLYAEFTPPEGAVKMDGIFYATLADAIEAVPGDNTEYTITVLESITIDAAGTASIGDGKHIKLVPGGTSGTISRESGYTGVLFTVNSGGSLALAGNEAKTLTIDGGAVLNGETNSGLSASASLVSVNGGTLSISEGAILQNNYNCDRGGGVYVDGGAFTMSGGTISENWGSDGGGVYIIGGSTFTMTGGLIANNTGNNGGGVNVGSADTNRYNTFMFSGGAIQNNKIKSGGNWGGGGVTVANGTLSMSGGALISGNETSTASKDTGGGGVCVESNGAFTMSCGTISGNSAKGSAGGGGVYISCGDFTKTGGTVYGSGEGNKSNTAINNNGHALYNSGGTATNNGNSINSPSNGTF
ncbi:MAG: hypothetical protein LBO04_08145 [Spirochaetaceae bacterium]|nr:hypothetical protein [Spirochaetaceae bacterium]